MVTKKFVALKQRVATNVSETEIGDSDVGKEFAAEDGYPNVAFHSCSNRSLAHAAPSREVGHAVDMPILRCI